MTLLRWGMRKRRTEHLHFDNSFYCRGTYGPGLNVGQVNLYTGEAAGPQTGVQNLLAVGDSMFPGIGVPAAAASGMYAAHSLVGVVPHLQLLNSKPGRNL